MLSSKPSHPKPMRNAFTLIQIKKMLGKKLIIPWKGLNVPPAELKEEAKKTKKKIIDSHKDPTKKIIITTVCINGVLNIIGGLDRAAAISLFSYKDLENAELAETRVIISQYPRMAQADIKNLILIVGK
jgi:hypothetical protein